MSMYHIIGITHEGNLDTVLDKDNLDQALAEAAEFADKYRQMFLVQSYCNTRELIYTPPTKGGWKHGVYNPLVLAK